MANQVIRGYLGCVGEMKGNSFPVLRKLLMFVALAVAVYSVDHLLASQANRITLKRDADFSERYNFESLDWSLRGAPICTSQRIFLFYKYQTCFRNYSGGDNPERWYYAYIYHRPLAVTSLIRVFPSSDYYFSEYAWGNALKIIWSNGTIESKL